MFAVTCYSLILKDWNYNGIEQKGYEMIFSSSSNTFIFILGNIVAFIVALLAIKFFIEIIKKYGFKFFGYYRIIMGSIILAFLLLK
jgi:undecaprenyl-diphosphatase